MGLKNKDDREKIKKKIKELKAHNDREKKDMEKEKNKREKLLKKAEKVIHVGKGKKWKKTSDNFIDTVQGPATPLTSVSHPSFSALIIILLEQTRLYSMW